MLKTSRLYIAAMRREYVAMVTAFNQRSGMGETSGMRFKLTVFREFRARVRDRVKRVRTAMRCRGF